MAGEPLVVVPSPKSHVTVILPTEFIVGLTKIRAAVVDSSPAYAHGGNLRCRIVIEDRANRVGPPQCGRGRSRQSQGKRFVRFQSIVRNHADVDRLLRLPHIEVDSSRRTLHIAAEECDRQVRAALETLPKEQASLIQMAYYEDLTQTAIAARTGLPLGTVKSRFRLAFARLRRVLEGDPS